MYFLFGIILPILFLFVIINRFRRRRIIRRICSMSLSEKLERLNEFIEPFGFEYLYHSNIFTSQLNALQREFGYSWLYDYSAPAFNIVMDCEPIYFNYNQRTWLIELWKGQYGINTGAEAGIYRADCIVPPNALKKTFFETVPNSELLYLSLSLQKNGELLFRQEGCHWWQTGFSMGAFSDPGELTLEVSITFPDERMLCAFADSLQQIGYPAQDVCMFDTTIRFTFDVPRTSCQPRCIRSLRAAISQLQNRIFCRMYLFFTKPFLQTVDRLLYLQSYLPLCFGKMIRIKNKRRRPRNRR